MAEPPEQEGPAFVFSGYGKRITSTTDGAKERLDVSTGEIEAEISDVKTPDDIWVAWGNDGVPLTTDEIAHIFSEANMIPYVLRNGENLAVMLKMPHDIHHIKVLGPGWVFEGDDYYAIAFGVKWGDVWQFDGAGVIDVKNEMQWFEFYNDSGGDISIYHVLMKQMIMTQPQAPVDQPLNVNLRDEAIWQDIHNITEYDITDPMVPVLVRILRYDEIRYLFDKQAYATTGIVLPDDHRWLVRFRKPFQTHSIEADDSSNMNIPVTIGVQESGGAFYYVNAEEAVDAKLNYFQLDNLTGDDVSIAEIIVKKFVHSSFSIDVSSGEFELRDIKSARDIAWVTGNEEAYLTPDQIQAIFDNDLNTYYTLEAGESLVVALNIPHDIHHIKIIDKNGLMLSGVDYVGVIYDITHATAKEYMGAGCMDFKCEMKIFEFHNLGRTDVDIGLVLIKQFTHTRVEAPEEQPLNVNQRDELTWQDVLYIELWEMVEEELTYIRNLRYDELRGLFDKRALEGPVFLLNPLAQLRVILNKPYQVEEIETLIEQLSPVNWCIAEVMDYHIYPADALIGINIDGVRSAQIHRKISAFDIINPDDSDPVAIMEIMAKKYTHSDVSIDVSTPIEVKPLDYKIPNDFAHVTLTPEEVDLTPEEIATMFDGDPSTFYSLLPQHSLRFTLKQPHDVHHIKILGSSNNIINNPDLWISVPPRAHPYLPCEAHGLGYAEPKQNVIEFSILNNSGTTPIDIYSVFIKQMSQVQASMPKWQPGNVTEQDYAVPDDFNLSDSEAQSTVGILSSHIAEWLDQDGMGPQFGTAWEEDPTIVLIPKAKILQVESIEVLEDTGTVVQPYTATNAILTVYPVNGAPITVYQRLWIPEIKVPIWKIEITLDHDHMSSQLYPFAIQIKKYAIKKVFSESQQPVKTEEDQEVTIQDVARMNIGVISEGEWEDDAELDMRQMKILFDKRRDTGYISIPAGGALLMELKTPRYIEEVEALGAGGIDINLTEGIKFWWLLAKSDGTLIEGATLDFAHQVLKEKVIAVILENLDAENPMLVYEILARLFGEQKVRHDTWIPVTGDEEEEPAVAADPTCQFAIGYFSFHGDTAGATVELQIGGVKVWEGRTAEDGSCGGYFGPDGIAKDGYVPNEDIAIAQVGATEFEANFGYKRLK